MVAANTLQKIEIQNVTLEGDLVLPSAGQGLVIFAHGGGSNRHSPRNEYVADFLQQGGLGTLLVDLLTRQEAEIDSITSHLRFNIEFLAHRVIALAKWVREHAGLRHSKIGLFGADTGGAAVLAAAAKVPSLIEAVIARGGRPDLAGDVLHEVHAPTLFIVGEYDYRVIDVNRSATRDLDCEKKMITIPGASYLFEEHGKLELVAEHARVWFESHL